MTRLDASQLCAMNFHYFRHSLTRFLDDAVEAGFGQIELWGAAPHFHIADESLASARRVRAAMRDRGLELVCFTPEQCIYPINLAAREEAFRQRSLKYFLECLDVCVEMEAPSLLITPGWGYVDESEAEAWERSRDALGAVAKRAERLGVTLLLEPLTPTESNVINTANDLRRMMDALGSRCVKAILDTAAMEVAGETVADYARLFGADLAHVHLIDGEKDGSHLAWGDGSFDLAGYMRELGEAGYSGALSLEFTSPRYWLEPFGPMRDSRDRVCSAMGAMRTHVA